MKRFQCQACGQPLQFEDAACPSCERPVGYLPALETMTALKPKQPVWRALAVTGIGWCEATVPNWMRFVRSSGMSGRIIRTHCTSTARSPRRTAFRCDGTLLPQTAFCPKPDAELCHEHNPPDHTYSARHRCASHLALQFRLGLLPFKRSRLGPRRTPGARSVGTGVTMAAGRKYSRSAGSDVKSEMHRYKRGTAKSGPGGRGGKVKSRKQAIAIGLSRIRLASEGRVRSESDPSRCSSFEGGYIGRRSRKRSIASVHVRPRDTNGDPRAARVLPKRKGLRRELMTKQRPSKPPHWNV